MKQKLTFLKTWWYLLAMDLKIWKESIVGKMIDLSIWIFCTVFVFNYLMPSLNGMKSMGPFMIAGVAAAAGLFEVYPASFNLLADLEGERIILYHLTLPLPPAFVFLRLACFYTINSIFLSIIVLPICKLICWNDFQLMDINWLQYPLFIITSSIFFASLTIYVTSRTKDLMDIGTVWSRFIFPMWFFGGFQFSWFTLQKIAPTLSYVALANPMVYITESARASILGPKGYINFWLCMLVIIVCSSLFALRGFARMKKRLDFI
jgi:ABC-type polysaccharide/polyol phosphate export permease